MSENLNKLKAILREMFQLDQADLDFGIYRIMNQKRDEILQFLNCDLLPQVKMAFASFQGDDLQSVRVEMDKLKKTLEDAGVVAETTPKYQALQAKLAQSVDVTALENDAFSQLTNFFRRYYQSGDFLSLRRYKVGVYAIPYEGEEVKLHWANANQYYIKSSENFRDYSFKLPSGKRAHFKLVDASTEQNNKKEQVDKERRFVLCAETPLIVNNGELFIRFEYKVVDGSAKQTVHNETTVQSVLAEAGVEWKQGLSTLVPTEKNPRRSLLEKHLTDYTAKYSFDYFIHKDLGSFMRRELDFFIKNEVLYIDDLDADHVKASISKVKVIKEIGHKVIAFLEQLENFQKKLWLKKKFVVETAYCCTIDKVPEELYPTIIANNAQVEDWKSLFAIEDIEGDLHTPSFTDPLTIDFLKTNPFLVLDTAFFGREFTERLVATFDNLDEATNGLLVHSENYQALNLLSQPYKGKIKCIYIDPPYNTGQDDFLYKDNYQGSSWLCMMSDRLSLAKEYLTNDGAIAISIDENEISSLLKLLDDIFGKENRAGIATVKRGSVTGHKAINKGIVNITEYLVIYTIDKSTWMPNKAYKARERNDRYNNFIINRDKDCSEWIIKPLLEVFAEHKKIPKGTIKKQLGDEFEQQIYTFVKSNPDSVIQLAYPDENNVSKDAQEAIKESRKDKSKILHFQRDNVPDMYLIGGQRLLFYSDRLVEIDGELMTAEPLSDIWDDILPNDLHNEGGVSLKKGKKPEKLLNRVYEVCCKKNDQVLDFFLGSGTAAATALKQGLKFCGIEQGDYFDTKSLIRMKLVNHTKKKHELSKSFIVKYIRLESYEDALNNLQLKRTPEQGNLLEQQDKLREQYMLSYMLDVESAGSTSLLNIAAFTDPFGYRMNIVRGNETKETVVDLVETFNWLLGIKVLRISQKEYRAAEFEADAEGRLQIKGRPRTCAAGEGWTFQEIEGMTLAGDKVLVIWRTLTNNPEQDNLMLDSWFSKRNYSTLDFEFARIYVNGDNNLENLKVGEERWKVALIEHEFKKLMFDVEGM